MEAIMAHLVDKKVIERANTLLLMGILWSGLAVCVLGALSYDIAHWFSACDTHPGACERPRHRRAGVGAGSPKILNEIF